MAPGIKRRFIPRLPNPDELIGELRDALTGIREELQGLRYDVKAHRLGRCEYRDGGGLICPLPADHDGPHNLFSLDKVGSYDDRQSRS